MQIITMYLRADSVNARLVDSYNQTISSLPALTRGMRAELILKLLDAEGEPLSGDLADYASWDFVIADDWNTATPPQVRVTDGITVSGNEVHIPLTETNTEELISALGAVESRNFGCELAGFEAGETAPGFLIQFNISIRNRRGDAGTGTPVPVSDGNYSAAQVRALFAAKLEVQLSDDGSIWYSFPPTREMTVKDGETGEENTTEEPVEVPQTARLYRFRNAAVGLEWSDPLPLLIGPRGLRSTIRVGTVTTGAETDPAAVTNSGDEHDAVFDFVIPQGVKGDAASVKIGSVFTGTPDSQASVTNSGDEHNAVFHFSIPQGIQGEKGTESYLYVAYAAQNDGQGFSLTPANSLRYRAEIISRTPIANPVWSDFADAQWVKYLGDDAATYGDVLVADQHTSVAKVTRIVFENATIRKGIDGEVIVNFNGTELSREEFSNYSVINGRTRLSPWTNGGGSPFGNLGRNIVNLTVLPELPAFEPYSTLIGEYSE